MRVLLLVAACAMGGTAWADEDLTVLKPASGQPAPRAMLHAYLLDKAHEHFEARRQQIAAIKTPQAVRARQQAMRQRFLEALGGFPEKTPLHARVAGEAKRAGYRIEKVIYESRPGHHITAVMYLPEGKPPFPGVLVPCGHSANGKAAEAYQRICILLALNGMAVLCYDPIGQGERVQLLDETGKPAIAGSTTEHTMAGIGALLVGSSAATYRIWDGIRSLDYLASRAEVDAGHLGCTGNSGGGTMTAYLMALDDRVAVAAPSCYITSLERLFATIGPQDAEQNITGQVAFGMDHADYVTMRAPKPTLLSVGTRDFFDINGSWDTLREAKLLYGRLGYGERVDLFESDEPHGFTRPRREAAMRWMRRWLLKKDDAPTEGEFPIFTDADLQCTKSGQVLSELHGVSVFDLNRAHSQELGLARAQVPRDRGTLQGEVERLIALPPARIPPARKVVGEIERDGYRVQKLVFETEPGIQVPGLWFRPEAAKPNLPLLLVSGGDRAQLTGPGGLVEERVHAGQPVLLVDLRGMGETAPAAPARGRPGPFGTDTKEAFLSLHLARPLLGQRAGDLAGVLDAMVKQAPRGIHLWAIGTAGPIALHAAAFHPAVIELTLEGSLVSWSAVAETPISQDQLSNVVPGALAAYDLPDLAAAFAPRPLTVRAALDPAGKRVDEKSLRAAYAPCLAAYHEKNAEGQLMLRAGR